MERWSCKSKAGAGSPKMPSGSMDPPLVLDLRIQADSAQLLSTPPLLPLLHSHAELITRLSLGL